MRKQVNNWNDDSDNDIRTPAGSSGSILSLSTTKHTVSNRFPTIPFESATPRTAYVDTDLSERSTKTLTRKQLMSQRQKDSRRKRRSAKAHSIGADSIKDVSRRRRNNAVPIFVEYDATTAPVVSTGWHGRRDNKAIEHRVYTTAEVTAMDDMAIIPWVDGYVYLSILCPASASTGRAKIDGGKILYTLKYYISNS